MTRAILVKIVRPSMIREQAEMARHLGIVGWLPVFDNEATARQYAEHEDDVIVWETGEESE